MKKFKIIAKSIFLIQLFSINILCQSWVTQRTNTNAAIKSICFLDSLNGWAITDSITYLHTTDGGDNWKLEKVEGEKYGLQQIQFITKEIGFACASQGRLFSTTDGGKTWTRYSGTFEIDFQDLSFVNEIDGWAVGQRYGENWGRGMIVHTSDGGKTWEKQYEHESTNQFATKFFKAIRMKNKNIGWAIAGDYFDSYSPTYVYKTEDGGRNWNILPTPIAKPARRIKIANNDTLWVDGYGVAPMSITVNGGINWATQYNDYKFIGGISPRSGNIGWCGYRDLRQGSVTSIIYTTDRGNTWKIELSVSELIIDIENKERYLWIAGSHGLIMRKELITTSVISRGDSDIHQEFELFPNYPNPFNPETIISYHLPEEADVEIKICNVLGEIITSYTFRNQQCGNNEIRWNAGYSTMKAISSGIYFYFVSAKTKKGIIYNKSSKMLLMK
ncbi:MAG: hypothetical protein FD122_2958 [Stygiobacter sp.]|nr:MAG: hypothetical protein FD122_2958 [Stygiobacter sp.]KAF0211279.1 MAG: hypothetical protein FD178_3465 [Ignavibacteria bacterium]